MPKQPSNPPENNYSTSSIMGDHDNRVKIVSDVRANYNSFFAMMKVLKERQDKILLKYKNKLNERKKEIESKKLHESRKPRV